jgi:hypothetical protein
MLHRPAGGTIPCAQAAHSVRQRVEQQNRNTLANNVDRLVISACDRSEGHTVKMTRCFRVLMRQVLM